MSRKLKKAKLCPECGKENIWFSGERCHNCYRSKVWKRKKKICPRCKRLLPLKAKNMCGGCYNITYRLEYQKALNQTILYGLDYQIYKKITKSCVICGFDKIVELHHLDQDRTNNSLENLIGLCPNHHKMLHNLKYKKEIFKLLKEKGFSPKNKKLREDIKGSY